MPFQPQGENPGLEELFTRPSVWLSRSEDAGIVISSRIRLARNLRDFKFPGWASDEERLRIWKQLNEILCGLPGFSDALSVHMQDLSDLDKLVLFERNLVSHEHINSRPGAGLVLTLDEKAAIMVNEEDHLRLQSIRPGQNLQEAWDHLDQIDNQIEQQIGYAYDQRLGFLTACPSNVGTGLRASVMLHVPGLVLQNEMNQVVKGLGKIGLAVRGMGGEGSEAAGNFFQVSNQITLGEKEIDIINTLDEIIHHVVKHEENARQRLAESSEHKLHDHVGRAQGILGRAHLLSSKEAFDLLSGLRLGVELGIIKEIEREAVDSLLLQTRPGHLQKAEKKMMTSSERDIARAAQVRKKLRKKRRN